MRHPAALWLAHSSHRLRARLGAADHGFAPFPAPELEHPATTLGCRPAIFDPEHLSRVTACGFNKNLSDLVTVLTETRYTERPLERYHLGPATALGGIIVTDRARHMLKYSAPPLSQALRSTPPTDRAVLANSTQGLRYFGHWLGDDVSAFEAHRDDPALVSLPLPAWSDAPPYQLLFDQHWRQQPVIRSRDMTLLRDLGFSRAKTDRYRRLRARLRAAMQGRATGDVVFIRRGVSAASREIANWQALERRLQDAGIRIVTPEGDTNAFVATLTDAAVIISVEGSQLCHAIYALRDGGALLVLQPPDRFYAAAQEWMRSLEMRCGMVIGQQTEGGFDIDPDEVLTMTDRLLTLVANCDTA